MTDHWRFVVRKSRDFKYFFRVFSFFLAAALCGCATAPVSVAPSSGVKPATYFELAGRISVRSGQRIDTAKIVWSRLPGEERIALFTPLGSQVAELIKKGADVALSRGGETLRVGSVAELSESLLGVPLELDAIASWTQGESIGDGETRSATLSDGGLWQVTVEGIRATGSHQYASRISAVRGDIVVRLIIDEWRAN